MGFIKGKQLADGTITSNKIDQTGSFDFSLGTVSVADPTQDSHAANKRYVDSVKQALDIKESVRVASTDTLNNENASTSFTYSNGVFTEDSAATAVVTLDGVQLASGDRVLLKDESTGANNGIYEVTTVGNGSTIAWVLTRASDFDSDDDVSAGAFCFVEEGTENGNGGFVLATDETIVLGTTALTFTQFSGAGQVVAGDGISKSGNTISVELDADSGLSVSASGLRVELSSGGGIATSTGQLEVYKADSSLTSDANGIRVNLNADGSIAVKGGAGLAAPVMASADLGQTPAAVAADDTDTTINITYTPSADGAVRVFVNGVAAELGDGVKTKDCYFTGDAGVTARAISDITAGDDLYWNGSSLYPLEISDIIDIVYQTIV